MVPGRGPERFRRVHACLRPGGARRHHGAPAALFHRGRNSGDRAPAAGEARRHRQADAGRRRGDRQPAEDLRLVRPLRGGRGDGRLGPERQEENPPLCRLPAGGIWNVRRLSRRAGQAGPKGRRADRRDRSDGGGKSRAREVRRRGAGALPDPESMTAGVATAPAVERHFWLRRLHSLSGIVPVGGFLAFHLYENYTAIRGADAYNAMTRRLQELPFSLAMEIFLIALPLLFHGIYGLFITATARPNILSNPYLRNGMYLIQRVTGVIVFAFILFHYWT